MNVNKVVLKIVKIGLSIVMALAVIYFTASVSITGFDFGYRVFTEPPMSEEPGKDIAVLITEDMSNREIGEEMYRKGLVRNDLLFWIQLELSAYREKVVPDTYVLNTSMTPKEIMMTISPTKKEVEVNGN